jgi:hypothetical protein
MRSSYRLFTAVTSIVFFATISLNTLWAQNSDVSPVPRVIRFSGTILNSSGKPQTGIVGCHICGLRRADRRSASLDRDPECRTRRPQPLGSFDWNILAKVQCLHELAAQHR